MNPSPADQSANSASDDARSEIELTGGAALVRMAAALGIRRAYGLASGKLGPVYQALADEPSIEYMGVRHEASAAFMATAIAALSDEIALCLGETGPGGLNLLSGLGGAFANSLPVVAVTSSNARSLTSPDLGAFSSSDNEALFAPLTKSSITITEVRRIPALLADAVRLARSGRPGPVHLNIPADVLAGTASFGTRDFADADYDAAPPVIMPSPDRVAEAAAMLGFAERPLVIVGGGLVRAGDPTALRAMIERLGWPAVTTQMGLGLIASDDPHLIGQGGIIGGTAVLDALRHADVIMLLGCRFSSWMWADGPNGWKAAAHQKVIQVDVDASAIGRVRPATIGIVGDAGRFVEQLSALMPALIPQQQPWLARLAVERVSYSLRLEDLATSCDACKMHPATLARAVGNAVGEGGIAIFDGGHTSFWSNDFTPAIAPRTRFHEPGMTHLGFGLPWAIAMKCARPELEVWCITGDGAFGFTLQELDTARREGTPIIIVIHNNAAFGVIGYSQARNGFSIGTDLADTDYAAIARGFGCFGETVRSVPEFMASLGRARASGLPAVIDARVAFDPHPMMAAFGRSTAAA